MFNVMRCYQEIGLNKSAEKFLRENVNQIPNLCCPDCGKVITVKDDIIKTRFVEMFYQDGANLKTYRLKDGRLAKEVIQTTMWSSGPMAFFCLEIGRKRYFEWSKEDLDKY